MESQVIEKPKESIHAANGNHCIIDTCNGALVKEQNETMQRRFEEMKQKFETNNPGEILYMCSIWFHDDMIVFERHCDSIWPMLSSLLTSGDPFAPEYRKCGVGRFLKNLFDISKGHRFNGNVDKGVLCRFGHPYNTERMVNVFLQMRFVDFKCVPPSMIAAAEASHIRAYTCPSCLKVCFDRSVYICERSNVHRKRKLEEDVL